MQEAMLWQKERNGVRCYLCARKCFVSKEKQGYCLVRKNLRNNLFTMNYGKILDISVEAVEKRSLFHFFPNTKMLSVSSPGTNVLTEITKVFKDRNQEKILGKDYTPEQIIKLAEEKRATSVSFGYAEPFIFFEFAYRTAKLAHRTNIKNIFVTNGYATEEAVKKIAKYLDAAVVNFKASADPQFYQKFMEINNPSPIFDVLKQMKKQRVHIEITDVIIPQVGDSLEQCRKLAYWVSNDIGSETPFHIVQFYPDERLSELPPTAMATLERCAEEASKTGLRYTYIDAVPPHALESTYCYNCRELLIQRSALAVKKINLLKDRCPNCGVRINLVS